VAGDLEATRLELGVGKQGVDVPQAGDELSLRMGIRTVQYRRLEAPERDGSGDRVTSWYWTVIVK